MNVMAELSRAREDARKLEASLRRIADAMWAGRNGTPHPAYGAVRRAESLAGASRTDAEAAIADVILDNAIGDWDRE